jgi:hypothetical protein
MDCLGAKLRVQRIPDHLHALAGRLALEGDNSNGDMTNQTGTTAYLEALNNSNGDGLHAGQDGRRITFERFSC